MTSNVVNLHKARKARARAEKQKQAAENRVRFGRPKSERERAAKVGEIERAKLDGALRDGANGNDPEPGQNS